MQNDKQLAITNTKPLTPALVKLFEKRWEKTINLHSDESRTTQSYGRSVNVISVKERMTNKKYKVVLNYHHQHNRHVGKCECGMWQEMYFPCKHAMMIIKQRCNNDKIVSLYLFTRDTAGTKSTGDFDFMAFLREELKIIGCRK